jgi:ribosomal protein S18 acetylase RimI-like enzyme
MSAADYRCERAGERHADDLLALFERAENGCYCNYWHFTGDKNAWLERCYVHPEENRAALVARLQSPELCGVVAHDAANALCGWMKVTRADAVQRVYEQRVYKNLPCFGADAGARDDVYTISCTYVDEAARGRGVARALLERAVTSAKEAGGAVVEAFPRGAPEGAAPLRPDEVWMGPEAIFLAAGFTRVSDFRPYPVLRLHLR